jgi:hypothetical protein
MPKKKRPKAPVDRLAGYGPYWEWALLPISLLASLRLWVEHHPSEDLPQDIHVVLQKKRAADSGNRYADFEVVGDTGSGATEASLLRGEYKLTATDPMGKLKEAVCQVLEEAKAAQDKKPRNVLIVVAAVGPAIGLLSRNAVLKVLNQSEVEASGRLFLEGSEGCFVQGRKGLAKIEVIVGDSAEVSKFFALRLLGQSHSASAVALANLLDAIMRPFTAKQNLLPEVIEAGGSIPLGDAKGFWEKLPIGQDALKALLRNPREKVLHDFSWMSVTGEFRYHLWTLSLIKLSQIETSDNLDDQGLDAAIDRMLSPMPLRMPHHSGELALEAVLSEATRSESGPTRIVIESHAGTGKSTLIRFLKWLETQRLHINPSLQDNPTIPLFLDLQKSDWSKNLPDIMPEDAAEIPDEALLCLLQGDRSPDFTNRDNVFSVDSALPAFLVLLATWKIDLFIDGYDQLGELGRSKLQKLGKKLAAMKVALNQLMVTSRPGHQADALWQNFVLKPFSVRDPQIDQNAITGYVRTWFTVVRSIAKDQYEKVFGAKRPEDVAHEFDEYLKTGDKEFVKTIKRTPLLLTITLAIFFRRKEQRPLLGSSETTLFEKILEFPTVGGLEKHQQVNERDLKKLAELSFALLMVEEGVLGAFSDNSFINIRGKKTTVLDLVGQNLLDKASILDVEVGPQKTLDRRYVHPSFQEYLACRHFVSDIHPGTQDSGVILGPNLELVSPQQIMAENGFYGTRFGEVVTRLGNQALKFVLGRIRSLVDHEAKLNFFLDCLARDFGLQQYLYDTECLEPAKAELEASLQTISSLPEDEGNVRRQVLLKKLIGHLHYASFDEQQRKDSLKHLQEAIDLCAKASFEENRWYRLFCYDHIQNRAPDQVRETNVEAFNKLVEEAGSPDSPDIRLRRAHFAGHLGNQVLRDLDSRKALSVEHLSKLLEKAEAEYTTALNLRAISFAECIAPDAPKPLLEARDRLLQMSGQEAAARSIQEALPLSAAEWERFSGPSQAIGDFANQLVGRGAIRCWRALEQRSRKGPDESDWMQRAEDDRSWARELWYLANETKIRAVRGERATKYVIYLAGLDARSSVLRKPGMTLKAMERDLDQSMNELALEFQISRPSQNDSRAVVPGVKRFFEEMQSLA